MEAMRSFLNGLLMPLARVATFSQHASHFIFRNTKIFHRAIMAMAATRRDSLLDNDPEPKRRMVHLKTKEECRLGNETIQVWTVELPSKHAEGILRVIKENVEGQDTVDLQHLRRFAKPRYLPEHVLGKRDKVKELYAVSRAWENTPASVMQAAGSSVWEYSNPGKSRNTASRPSTLHLLVCPTKIIDLKTLHALLSEHTPFASNAESWAYPLEIKDITVPLLAPTSSEQADKWSLEYWPTFYRKTNPFGAHPASIQKAEDELQNPQDDNIGIDEALALAEKVGDDHRRRGIGTGAGCCIIERVEGQTQIIALAGDARYKPQANAVANEDTGCHGSPMGHAIMRAVGMVGRKRLRCASQPVTKAAAKAEGNFAKGGLEHDIEARDAFFCDQPLTSLENEHFVKDNMRPDGYLCLKLEIFLTHEPCIMCSMALVHSRVGRVIFKRRMPKTGGLTAEMVRNESGPVSLGYGMCWRKELNWQFMCWEYMPEEEEGTVMRQDLRNDSTEKYQEAEDSTDSESANVTLSSFARMHV
ncbi:tRNA-specific adenosine deaminase subunit TAD3 [Fulvia fulva]|uniref:tRNA-specific adenosine deaminase subunit TAD3 n=1 Tax=Passalora fulva TaxID=5499 RepID=A0A9Q8L9F5_PASFU|nr:tRNA-specific adenosine deaminase subunit TAD3 [Fulvia fulva]KAK4633683.1 tRNA-specific adenosine deaminase subunit TAD3 [Fulvia fulva]UJO13282.1 tRNA-specific adenosine deaminase subunit TAD3 [Fulvia fulva]WPV12007.1 tRNA-specific adenosine deaminase subunit TAD3 [Fulvia fulva]